MSRQVGPGYQPGQPTYDRGGYNTGLLPDPEDLKLATSTFENYVSGTVIVVFSIFFTFLFISLTAMILMSYARYLNKRRHRDGFYKPPPMVFRSMYKATNGSATYSTLQSRQHQVSGAPTYESLPRSHQAPSAMSHQTSRESNVL